MSDGLSVNSLQLKWMTETLSVFGRAMNEPLIRVIFLQQISKAFCMQHTGKCYSAVTYSGDVTQGVSIIVSLCSNERETNLIKSFIKVAGVCNCTTLVRFSIVYYLLFIFISEIIIYSFLSSLQTLLSKLMTSISLFVVICLSLSLSLCVYVCMYVNITCSVCVILVSTFLGQPFGVR